jgi:hypothetical protein
MTDLKIAEIRKNAKETFVIAIVDHHGRRGVDLRVHASNGVDVVPTPKGVAIKPASLRPIIEALEKAEQAAKAEGLL